MPSVKFPVQQSLGDLYVSGLGFVSMNYQPATAAAGGSPTSQLIYAVAVPYRAGQVVTNLVWLVATAAAGTVPTSIVTGLASSSAMLAQSAELKNNAGWTSLGIKPFALSAAYTIPSDGIYYHLFLQNGTWGTTALQLARATNQGSVFGSSILYGTAGSGQTALPANGAAVTLVTTSAQTWWAASS